MKIKNQHITKIITFVLFGLLLSTVNYNNSFKIGLVEYSPGDWNSDETALSELLKFIHEHTDISISQIRKDNELKVNIGDEEFFKRKYLYMTGHGELRKNGLWQGIKLTKNQIKDLRKHLLNGGFLHVDDNYNFDKTFFNQMKFVFPEKEWVVLEKNHEIFNIFYKMKNGLPKIHKHDNKKPKALGMYHNDRLIILYTLESDLGDGWETDEEHIRITGTKLDRNKKIDALKMGTNIIIYALTH